MLHLPLNSPIPTLLLIEWAKAALVSISWKDALAAAAVVSTSFHSNIIHGPDTLCLEFMVPPFTIYRALCERLEAIDLIMDASECFCQMVAQLAEQTNTHVERVEWVLSERSRMLLWCHCLCGNFMLDFKRRCSGKLEDLGDDAMRAGRHDDAIFQYSAVLSLNLTALQGLIKRSKAYIASGLWVNALNDANQVCFMVSQLVIVDRSSLGDHARSIISMGL